MTNLTIEGIHGEGTVEIYLDSIPTGLSGYNMTISIDDPSIAEIESIELPPWATLYKNSTLPSFTIWIKAVDLNDKIGPGEKNVLLARLKIRPISGGNTTVSIAVTALDDDYGNPIITKTTDGWIKVLEVPTLPGCLSPPKDLDSDGLYEDVNGNNRLDFDDVVKLFFNIEWLIEGEYGSYFDFNRDGDLDFDDVVALFDML